MLAGKPDAGNPHVRFDEGEQRDWRMPPVALYSTGSEFNYAEALGMIRSLPEGLGIPARPVLVARPGLTVGQGCSDFRFMVF